jgi:hypothetical protein
MLFLPTGQTVLLCAGAGPPMLGNQQTALPSIGNAVFPVSVDMIGLCPFCTAPKPTGGQANYRLPTLRHPMFIAIFR